MVILLFKENQNLVKIWTLRSHTFTNYIYMNVCGQWATATNPISIILSISIQTTFLFQFIRIRMVWYKVAKIWWAHHHFVFVWKWFFLVTLTLCFQHEATHLRLRPPHIKHHHIVQHMTLVPTCKSSLVKTCHHPKTKQHILNKILNLVSWIVELCSSSFQNYQVRYVPLFFNGKHSSHFIR